MPSSQSDEHELTIVHKSPKNLDEVNQSVEEWREFSQKSGQLEPDAFSMMDDGLVTLDVMEDQQPPNLTTFPAQQVLPVDPVHDSPLTAIPSTPSTPLGSPSRQQRQFVANTSTSTNTTRIPSLHNSPSSSSARGEHTDPALRTPVTPCSSSDKHWMGHSPSKSAADASKKIASIKEKAKARAISPSASDGLASVRSLSDSEDSDLDEPPGLFSAIPKGKLLVVLIDFSIFSA